MKTAIIDDSKEELENIFKALKHTQLPELARLNIDYYTNSKSLIKNISDYDFFILDWYIDENTGLDLLEIIRKDCKNNPSVIMLTTNSREEDVSTALIAGADDYLVKPFRDMELCARIFNVMRRKTASHSPKPAKTLNVKDFNFNDHTLEIMRGEKTIKLTLREYQIAKFLFSHLGEPISRKLIYENFWKKEEKYSSRSLDTHIYRIRTQLELTVEHGWQLHTIYGYGYRLEPIDKVPL